MIHFSCQPIPYFRYLLTKMRCGSPRPKPELGDPILDMGWSSGGEESDGGHPPRRVDPYEYLKNPVTGKKGISSLTIDDNKD